jgi:hypothetical protein
VADIQGIEFTTASAGQDSTSTVTEVDTYQDSVVLKHGKMCKYTLHDAQTAMDLATEIARASYAARNGIPYLEGHVLVSLKDEILNRKREILHNRMKLTIPQMIAKKKTWPQIVNFIIDSVLREIT